MQTNPNDQNNPSIDDLSKLYRNHTTPTPPQTPPPVSQSYTPPIVDEAVFEPNPQDLYQNNIPETPEPQDLYQQYESTHSVDSEPTQPHINEEVFTTARPETTPSSIIDYTETEEEKKGNRLFYIITGIISLILLIIIGVLAFLIYFNSNNTDSDSASTNSSSSSELVSDSSSSSSSTMAAFIDPNGITPAGAALINQATDIDSSWLASNFADSVNQDTGECNNDTVCSPTADPDSDGMDNLREYNYQLNPNQSDTDNDGIGDGDEINVYSTNPKENDSDGDKIDDLTEILACTDPAVRTFSPILLTENKQNEISGNIDSFTLSEKTVSSLIDNNATQADIAAGVLLSNCQVSNVVFN